MIEVYQHEEAGRTPGFWIAEAVIDGTPYAARSQHGAPHELARLLVTAGIPDQPMIVRSFGLAGHATYRSLHTAAKRTITENASIGPISARWSDPELVDFAGLRARRETNAVPPVSDVTRRAGIGGSVPDAPEPLPVMSHSKCTVCGTPIEPVFRGPERLYCRAACRKRASRLKGAA